MASRPPTPPTSTATTLFWLGAIAAAGVAGYVLGNSRAPMDSSIARGPTPTAIATTAAHPADATPPHAAADGLSPTEHRASADAWQDVHAQPDTPARDRALADTLEQLARTDPHRALELAVAERNWRLRQLLRDAAVKGWAQTAPDAAAEWVLTQKGFDRRSVVAALFDGAAQQPGKALQIARHVIDAAPESASEYAHLAIDSLGRAGEFQSAAALATQLAPSDGSLLNTAYLQWGERDPDAAFSSLRSLTDPQMRRSALEGIVSGWAQADPEQLATRARQFADEDRQVALSAALSRWGERDPMAAANWIEANDPGKDADDGVLVVSQQSSLADTNPQVALHWAGLIVDPAKRTMAEQSVLSRWAARDPAAARQYAEALADPTERTATLAILPKTNP